MVSNDVSSSFEESQIVASRLTPPIQSQSSAAPTLLRRADASHPGIHDGPSSVVCTCSCFGTSDGVSEILVLGARFGNIVVVVVSRGFCSGGAQRKGHLCPVQESDDDCVLLLLLCECYCCDYRFGIDDAELDVVRCDGVGLQGRMNTDGRSERTVTDSGFTSSSTISSSTTSATTSTTSSATPVTSDSSPTSSSSSSSSSSSWHSAITAVVSRSEPQVTPSAPYGLRIGPAGFFRPPLTPLEQASPAARIYPPFDHGSLFSGTSSQFSPGFYPRLAHPRPSYSPAGAMTAGLQQAPQAPYLTPSEPFASSLIQISPLPHLIQPPMQYPSYVVGSLGGDTIAARHHVMAQHHHHQQQQQQQQHRQQPSPLPPHRLTPAELFHRSPMPEESPVRGSRSPYRDDRPSHLHHPHTRGGSVGPRTLVYFSPPPLPALSHHVMKKHPADTGLSPSARMPLKDPFAVARSTRGSVSRESVVQSRGPQIFSELVPHRSPVAYGRAPTRSPVPPTETRRPLTPPEASAPPQQPHYPPHFMRGSIIQLGNGRQKRVEELETRDFVESAGISENLQIDSSTVVHMRQNHERNTVVLGFAVGQQNIQVTVEATLEHPFFVYNQGWSSYSPERTRLRYGLTCHQLRVGNCCISLTQRDTQSPPAGAASSTPQHHPTTYPEPPRRGSSSRPHRSPQISHALGAPEPAEGAVSHTTAAGSRLSSGGPPSVEQHSHQSSLEPHGCSSRPSFPSSSSGIATHSVESLVACCSSSSSFSASAVSSIPTRVPHLVPPTAPVQLASSSLAEVTDEPRGASGTAAAVAASRSRKRRSSAPDVFHHSDNIPPSTGEGTTGGELEEDTEEDRTTGEGDRRRSGVAGAAAAESPFQASSSPEGS